MTEADFDDAAMKVSIEMADRQALMRGYRIPPELIYESMSN
jgi:hypothetical protein